MAFTVGLFIVGVIAIVIVVIIAARKMTKQKGVFAQYLTSGEEEERKGNDRQAVSIYTHALAVILGLEQGSIELTAKGIGLLFEQDGKKAVEKIQSVYTRNGIQYSWDELYAILAELQKMSINAQLVDRYGLPKGAGKELLPVLMDRLKRCVNSLPDLSGPKFTQAPVMEPPAVPGSPLPPIPSTPSATPLSIPSAEEYAARKPASNHRTLIIVLSIVGGVLVLCLVVLCVIFVIIPLLAGSGINVINNINSILTPTP